MAYQRLRRLGQQLRSSFVYETDPIHVTSQPLFMNAVVEMETDVPPKELLREVKRIEKDAGRGTIVPHVPNGPRPLDVDVLLYEGVAETMPACETSGSLQIPHPRMHERRFVLQPLMDLMDDMDMHPIIGQSFRSLLSELPMDPRSEVKRVFPITDATPWSLDLPSHTPYLFGVLNVTPDSFSDGGQFSRNGREIDTDLVLARVAEMVENGVDVVDVGAESTRPMAERVDAQTQLDRALPTIERIRNEYGDALIVSIDTTSSKVAREACRAGANMINDVSGGLEDDKMIETIASCEVPTILMHRRGNAKTMTSTLTKTYEGGVVEDVSMELCQRLEAAQRGGVPLWDLMMDPGVGFGKTPDQSFRLLRDLDTLSQRLRHVPLLLGASRKRFLGYAVGRPDDTPISRDVANAVLSALLAVTSNTSSPLALRVHDVRTVRDAISITRCVRDGRVSIALP